MTGSRNMEKAFQGLYDFCLSKSVWTLVGFAALVFLSAVAASRLNIELNLYDHVVSELPATAYFAEEKHRFGSVNLVDLIFSNGGKPFSRAEACAIRDWIHEREASDPELVGATSGFSLRSAQLRDGKMWYPLLLKPDCESADPGQSMTFKELRESPWRELLTDRAGMDIGAEFNFRDTPGGSRVGAFDPAPVRSLLESAESDLKRQIPGLEIRMVGASAFALHLKEALFRDLALQSLVFLVLFAAFRWVFGTWKSGFIYGLTIALDLVLTYGMMAATKQPLDLLTNNLLLMTAIAGLEDFLFVTIYRKSTGADWRKAFRVMALPCFFTTLTTVVGFLSLLTADIAIVGRFGLWAGWAALMEWVVMFLVLPSACARFVWFREWLDFSRMGSTRWITRMATWRLPRAWVWASALTCVLGLVSFPFLNLNENPTANFPEGHANSRAYAYLQNSRGWDGVLSIVFEDWQIQNRRGEVRRILKTLERDPLVAGVLDPFDVQDFIAGADRLPAPLVDAARLDFQITPLYHALFSARDEARALLYLKRSDLNSLAAVRARIEEVCASGICHLAGQSAIYLEYSRRVIPTLLSSFGSCLILVLGTILALTWLLRIPQGARICYCTVWGPLTMFGLIALLQIPVSLITSLFGAVIVGLTGDNTIQFLFAANGRGLERGIAERAEASILLSMLLAGCSAVFLLESVKPMRILGGLLVVGFLVNLVGDVWLLRGSLGNGADQYK